MRDVTDELRLMDMSGGERAGELRPSPPELQLSRRELQPQV